ncbi:MAG: GAF domain-containing protein [Pseudomonadota bacterium]
MTDADRLAEIKAATDPCPLIDRHLNEIIGHKLFTLMVIDHKTEEAARVYSSAPEAYPVKGRKPLGTLTGWGHHVISEAKPYIGRNADDIRTVFPDHETIASLGCASVLNLPVIANGSTIGTVNLLHEAEWYNEEHVARGAPFAALLAPHFEHWSDG